MNPIFSSVFTGVSWNAVMRNMPPAFVVACHKAPAPDQVARTTWPG